MEESAYRSLKVVRIGEPADATTLVLARLYVQGDPEAYLLAARGDCPPGAHWEGLSYVRWETRDRDLAELSLMLEGAVLVLQREPEDDPEGLERIYYHRGRLQRAPAKITFPPFDPGRLFGTEAEAKACCLNECVEAAGALTHYAVESRGGSCEE